MLPTPTAAPPATPLAAAAPLEGVHVVLLHGELDLACRPACALALAAALEAPTARVVVDLRGVTFLDAGFVGLLVGLAVALRRQGRRLDVVNARPATDRVLRLTQAHRAMAVHASRPEGVGRGPALA